MIPNTIDQIITNSQDMIDQTLKMIDDYKELCNSYKKIIERGQRNNKKILRLLSIAIIAMVVEFIIIIGFISKL